MPMLGKRKRDYKPKYVKRRGSKRITGRYTKRRRVARPQSFGRYGQNGIPTSILKKFNYVEEYAITATHPAAGFRQWRLNSLNDPDLTGTGHQAMDHDALLGTTAGLWEKYIIYGCKVKLTLINRVSNPMRVIIRPMPHIETAAATDDFDALSEQTMTADMILPAKDAVDGRFPVYKRYIDIRKLEGVRELDYSLYEAVANGNPSYVPKLNLWVRALTSESHDADLNVLAKFTFYAKCFQVNTRVTTN